MTIEQHQEISSWYNYHELIILIFYLTLVMLLMLLRVGWPFVKVRSSADNNQYEYRKKSTSNGLAIRQPSDAREFLHIDKLDKYLDLLPLMVCVQKFVGIDDWDLVDRKKYRSLFNDDTREMLRRDGVNPSDLYSFRIDPTIVAKLLIMYTQGSNQRCHMGTKNFRHMMGLTAEASRSAVYLQVKHIISHMSPSLHNLNDKILKQWTDDCGMIPPEVLRMLAVSEDWMKALEINRKLMKYARQTDVTMRVTERLRDVQHHLSCPSFGAELWLYPTITIMYIGQTKYILNHDLFLECHNKACELYCTLVYSWQLSITVLPKTHLEQVIVYLRHLASVVSRYGTDRITPKTISYANSGFAYLKAIEALGVATIIAREDKQRGWINTTLSDAIWKSLVDAHLVHQDKYTESELYAIFKDMQIAQIAEILGIIKLCGHPSIEVQVGLNKLYERTHNNIIVDQTAVQRSIGILTRDLTKNFYRRHGRYPVFDTSICELPPALSTLVNSGIGLFSNTRGRGLWSSLTVDQWSTVQFGKNEEFDTIENRLPLLKDKAIGLTRTRAYKLLLTELGHDNNSTENAREKRRVLLQYLLSPYMDEETTQYLHKYMNDTEWCQDVLDYMVIKLTPKELEEKAEGRMFGASPIPERNRRIIQEYNVMKLMDQYIDDQIMTPDELSMVRKLYSFRCFNAMYPNHSLLQVSFDFSRWNNNMRANSIDVPGAAILDRWFGTSLYGKTMKFYQNALMYYHDGYNARHWEGQEGGIEGLNQATWSFVFIGGIKQALEELGLSYQLTVKGDDVRAAIAIDNNLLKAQGPEVYRDWVLNQLMELCHQMGWQLNPQECFVSLSVIATSKQYQVNDTWLPASTKKMMKALALTNVVFPTIEDIVASAFSTAHSAANQSPVLLPAYYTATLVASRELLRRFNDTEMTVESLISLLVWSQCLGGPGALPLQTYFVRGENDMLAVTLSLLRFLILNGPSELKPFIISILSQPFSEIKDPKLLLMDPYSLSLNTPERPQARLKKLVRSAVKKYTKNPDLIQLLTIETDDEEEIWCNHLLSMVPYHAKVATVLWENSPFYLIEEVLAKFMQSATIFDFLCYKGRKQLDRRQGYKALCSILECEQKRYNYWRRLINTQYDEGSMFFGVEKSLWFDLSICTTKLVHLVRSACWGREIVGLTYPSLVDQNILTTPEDAAYLAPNWNMGVIANTIHINLSSCKYQTTDNSLHYSSLPDNTPWLGAVTSGKAKLVGLSTRIQSPTISKIMKLIYLKSAGSDLGSEFVATVNTALRALTTVDLTQLVALDPEISGGHIPHRTAMNSYSMTTMPNSRPNLTQLVRIDETCPAILRGDMSNRTINYAARYFYCVLASLMPLQLSPSLPETYPHMIQIIFHEDLDAGEEYKVCPYCCNIVDSAPPTFKIKLRPNMTKFCTIPLVGSSEHDKRVLTNAIREAIDNRARKFATEVYGDPSNPIIQQVATQIVLCHFGKDAQKVYEAAMGSGFMRVPQGKLLEALSVTMGIRALSRVSINLLRCAQPDFLYAYLLSTLIQWFIGTVGIDIDTCPVERALQTQSHLSSLSGLLSQMTTAGVMGRICRGAIIVQGPEFRLRWGPQDLKDSSAAVQTFIRQHEDFLIQLCEDPMICPRFKLFVDLESGEVIREKIKLWRNGVTNFVLTRLLTYLLKNNVFRLFDWGLLQKIHQLDKDSTKWTEEQIEIAINWFIEKFSSDHPDTMCLGWIYGFLQSHTLLIPVMNDCEEPDAAVDYRNDITLFREDGEGIEEEVDWSEGYVYNHESGIRIIRVFSAQKVEIMFQVVKLVLGNDSLNYPLTGYKEAQIYILRLIGPVNKLILLSMTLEDAERIMKSEAYELVTAAKMLQQINEDDATTNTQLSVFPTTCRIQNDSAHDQNITAGGIIPLGPIEEDERPHPLLSQCQKLSSQPFQHKYLYDLVDLSRIIGYNNTSVAKFAELIYKTGLYAEVINNNQPITIVCAADGLGGVTAMMLRLFPKSDVIYNSLYIMPGSNAQTGDANVYNPPTEVLALPEDVIWTNRLHYKGLFPGDLNEIGVRENIMNLVRFTRRHVTILTFDAEIMRDCNFDSAKQLWASVIDLIRRINNPNLHVILKLFALNTTTVYNMLNCLCGIFKHFHIRRSESTRSHSTEFLFYGAEPLNTISPQLIAGVKGHIRLSERAGVNSYIVTKCNEMSDVYNMARSQGLTAVPNVQWLIRVFSKLRLPPTPIACHNRALGCKVRLVASHLCDSLKQTTDNVEYRLSQLEIMMQTMDDRNLKLKGSKESIRHTFKIFGKGSDVMAQGPNAMIKFIKSYWRVKILNMLWKRYTSECQDLRNLCSPENYMQHLEACLTFISRHVSFSECEFEYHQGEIFLNVNQHRESVTLLLRSCVQRVLQMIGSSLYAFYLTSQSPEDYNVLLQEYMPGCYIEQCCINKAQWALDLLRPLANNYNMLPASILITENDWIYLAAKTNVRVINDKLVQKILDMKTKLLNEAWDVENNDEETDVDWLAMMDE